MRPEKPSTRRRGCSGCLIPADRRSKRSRERGNPRAHAFPRHRPAGDSLDLSFSGLKTSVRYFLESEAGKNAKPEDVAASFQAAVVDVLMARVKRRGTRLLQRGDALGRRRGELGAAREHSAPGPSATASRH